MLSQVKTEQKFDEKIPVKTYQVADETEDLDEQGSLLPGTEYDNTSYLRNFEDSTSRDFMDEVTYRVPLKTLYKVVRNSTTNDSCDF